MVQRVTWACLLILAASFAIGQTAGKLEFEVASVKINKDNGPSDMRGPRRSGDSVIMHNALISSVISYAYHLTATYQVAGFKDPSDDSRWVDIEARAAPNATEDQIRMMFQSLLEDRFKLKVHHETREIPEYELTIAKGKAKLTPAREGDMTLTIEGRTFPARAGACGTTLWQEGNHIACHAAGMETIASQLSGLLQSPVTDHTGLTGKYDLDVLYLPEGRKLEADAPPAPLLVDAVQESLGLKLEKVKGPVDVLVIDHLEKPSQN
jgi:uncharacterized protein (TIGR03435 family)